MLFLFRKRAVTLGALLQVTMALSLRVWFDGKPLEWRDGDSAYTAASWYCYENDCSESTVLQIEEQLINWWEENQPNVPRVRSFREVAATAGTDKISYHNYWPIYEKYLDKLRRHDRKIKLLEFGLGCNDWYRETFGSGKSVELWRQYFPQVEIHMVELERDCAESHRSQLDGLYIGDMTNHTFLESVVRDSGGQFDVIVDDGGHGWDMQLNSFTVFFANGLRKGGLYIIEDIHTSYDEEYANTGDTPTMTKMHSILDALMITENRRLIGFYKQGINQVQVKSLPRVMVEPLRRGVQSLDCAAEICVLTKSMGEWDYRYR